jgi:hypothetical protein
VEWKISARLIPFVAAPRPSSCPRSQKRLQQQGASDRHVMVQTGSWPPTRISSPLAETEWRKFRFPYARWPCSVTLSTRGFRLHRRMHLRLLACCGITQQTDGLVRSRRQTSGESGQAKHANAAISVAIGSANTMRNSACASLARRQPRRPARPGKGFGQDSCTDHEGIERERANLLSQEPAPSAGVQYKECK